MGERRVPPIDHGQELAEAEAACTSREALYANYIATGLTPTEAAVQAGLDPRSGAMGRIRKDPRVGDLIQRLRADTADELRVTRLRIAKEVARIAFCSVNDAIDIDENGSIHFRPDMDTDALASIEALEEVETKYGTNRKVRFWPKVAALKFLSELLGYTTDSTVGQVGAAGLTAGMTPLEAAEYAIQLQKDVERIRQQALDMESRAPGNGG